MDLEGFGAPSFYSFQFWWYGSNQGCVASIPHKQIAYLCLNMGAWLSVLDLLKAQIDCSYFFIGQCSILCTELVDFPWFNIWPDPLASFSGSNSLWHFCLNDLLWHIPSPLIIVQFPCRLIWIRKSWVRFQCCKLLSSQIWATSVSCVRHMVVPNYEWLLTASLVVLCDQPANLVCCYSSYYINNVT